MDEDTRKLFELINGEIIRIERRTNEIAKIADAAMISAQAAVQTAKETSRKADAAWELVVITKNEFSRPWFRKIFS